MTTDEAVPAERPLHQDATRDEQVSLDVRPKPPWFVRFGDRTHPLVLPVLLGALLLLPYFFLDPTGSIFSEPGMSPRRRFGTILMFILVPGYALAMQYYGWRVARQTAEVFAAMTPPAARVHARRATERPGWWMWPVIVIGTLLGLYDFSELYWLANIGNETAFDLWFRFLATVTWALVFWLLVWRVHCALEFKRLGAGLDLDVYQLDGLAGFVRVPLFNLLVVVGAMALMPLQSLDFELRWFNFRAGLIVSIPSVLALVLPPIWGLHTNMRDVIKARVAELQVAINACDRSDFGQLALLTEHRETVRDFNSWPLDVGLVGKVLFYVIIPPLAWVAAALVEQLVDKAVG